VLGVVDAEGDVGVMGHRSIVTRGPRGQTTAVLPGGEMAPGIPFGPFWKEDGKRVFTRWQICVG
jgi:hypothetical protein